MNELSLIHPAPCQLEQADDAISLQDMDEALRQLGLHHVGSGRVSSLRRLGVGLEQHGAVKMQQGYLAISQEGLSRAFVKVIEELQNNNQQYTTDAFNDLLHNVGFLAGKMTQVALASTKISAVGGKIGDDRAKKQRPSFKPGQIVGPNIIINANECKQDPAAKAE